MTIRDAILGAISDTIEKLRDGLADLLLAKREGKGGFIFNDEQSVFISGNETGIAPDSIITIEQNSLTIQAHRGTNAGIYDDIKRLCHTDNVQLTLHDQLESGWILGVTSPGFDETGNYAPELSLTYLNLDNMLDIITENQSIRTDDEVKNIISKYFIPLKFNKRFFVNPIDGIGYGGIGVTPAGGIGAITP
jgi:hypothetical protein